MFETANPSQQGQRDGAPPVLRVLTWREVVARVDSRRSHLGAFPSARDASLLDHRNCAVNPSGLGNLKPEAGIDSPVADVCELGI